MDYDFDKNKEYKLYCKIGRNNSHINKYSIWKQRVINKYGSEKLVNIINFERFLNREKRGIAERYAIIRDILIPFSIAFIAVLIAILTVVTTMMPTIWGLLKDVSEFRDEMSQNSYQMELTEDNVNESDINQIMQTKKTLDFTDRIQEVLNTINKDYSSFAKMLILIVIIIILFSIVYIRLFNYLKKRELFYEDVIEIIIEIKKNGIELNTIKSCYHYSAKVYKRTV